MACRHGGVVSTATALQPGAAAGSAGPTTMRVLPFHSSKATAPQAIAPHDEEAAVPLQARRRHSFLRVLSQIEEPQQVQLPRSCCDRWIIPETSRWLAAWDVFRMLLAFYSVASTPLLLAFPGTRYRGHVSFETLVDLIFLAGVGVRLRISYSSRGEPVWNSRLVALNYLKGWFLIDLCSSLPLSQLATMICESNGASHETLEAMLWLRLLRTCRVKLIIIQFRKLKGANVLRIAQMLVGFVTLAHYLGCAWYVMVVWRLQASPSLQAQQDWMWKGESQYDTATLCALWNPHGSFDPPSSPRSPQSRLHATDACPRPSLTRAHRYVCSLYWALSIMTNLKGINAHESRQCLWRDPLVPLPLQERLYAIAAFLLGATFYSIIYGNIGQFVSNLYSTTVRYKRRMAEVRWPDSNASGRRSEACFCRRAALATALVPSPDDPLRDFGSRRLQIDEFINFHSLPPPLGQRIRKYVDFAFSVTKGINVDAVASQLPPHLMLDVYLQLNREMVKKVSIFDGCSDDFYHAVVMKLQPAICTAGDYVFYRGESGERMYFIKRGRVQVMHGETVVHTFLDDGYFGEIALIADTPRTADVKCVSNCMLLSLSSADLESIFGMHPKSREIFMGEAQKRLAALERINQRNQVMQPIGSSAAGQLTALPSCVAKAPSLDHATVITGPKIVPRSCNFKQIVEQAMKVQVVSAARRLSSSVSGAGSGAGSTTARSSAASATAAAAAAAAAAVPDGAMDERPQGEPACTGAAARAADADALPDDAAVDVAADSGDGGDIECTRSASNDLSDDVRSRARALSGDGPSRPLCGEVSAAGVVPTATDDGGIIDGVPTAASVLSIEAASRLLRSDPPVKDDASTSASRRPPRRLSKDLGLSTPLNGLDAAKLPPACCAGPTLRVATSSARAEEGATPPAQKLAATLTPLAALSEAAGTSSMLESARLANAPEQMQMSLARQITEVLGAVGALQASVHTAQAKQAQQIAALHSAVHTQAGDLRQTIETLDSLVTEVNDISRVITEASRSQSRWM